VRAKVEHYIDKDNLEELENKNQIAIQDYKVCEENMKLY
jgi:hypothetical protein